VIGIGGYVENSREVDHVRDVGADDAYPNVCSVSAENCGDGSSSSPRVIMNLIGNNMIRTQISLDEHEYDIAKREARTLGISVAEFVRRAVREALPPHGQVPWMRYAGLVETGNPSSSQSVDEIVYGQKG